MESKTEPEFENYSDTSQVYDSTRIPVGLEEVIYPLIKPGFKVGDFGCGTGNYLTKVAQNPQVEIMVGFEFNEGMIKLCQQKVSKQGGIKHKTTVVSGSLLEDRLPFAKGFFDLVFINQVVHHLDTGEDPSFPNIRKMIFNISEVIRPGGFFSLSMSTRQQADSYWWQYLIPEAKKRYMERHIPTDLLLKYLSEAGFTIHEIIPIFDPLQGDAYYSLDGPLNESWRKCDSIWSMVSDQELETAMNNSREQLKLGTMKDFFNKHDQIRRQIGQSTFFVAVKN